jgi:hypothetical protein
MQVCDSLIAFESYVQADLFDRTHTHALSLSLSDAHCRVIVQSIL